ncbi:TIGR02453 family protein [Naumannella halotolerans]|uniref:Uncharacterized protein (TIGR02453 family) n=1 Tax=Naumannella halotolerans TaxID=993414 RepID=A0A4R7IZF7_9ACTN|nr:DUF2461 domain-containing protein [Naumannella halotolerans]TDT30085.1 uncharacterized protein (TIGR02453 family) [Naumannella halotolerans]
MVTTKAKNEGVQFTGLPTGLFRFLDNLEADNSKEFFDANRETYNTEVKTPVDALKSELERDYGPLKGFRINRDVRFSKDKSPYKTWVGLTTTDRAVGGVGSFWQATAHQMKIATGAMMLESDQLVRYRDALIDQEAGSEFDQIRRALSDEGLDVGPGDIPQYKRVPRGYPADHSRSAELQWKGAIVIHSFNRARWMQTDEVVDRIGAVWSGAQPLLDWFETHVGDTEKATRKK